MASAESTSDVVERFDVIRVTGFESWAVFDHYDARVMARFVRLEDAVRHAEWKNNPGPARPPVS